MIKLPDKKYESKHNNKLYDYAKGWNSTIMYVKYLCNEYDDAYAKEHLSKSKEARYERVILPYYEGQYDCIVEIEKLNEEVKPEHRKAFDDMFKESFEALDKLKVERKQ